ncbi:TerB family tellurite resistance protein [Aliiglaciecola litoralis]|uniref:Co-chaperone DjlA N-terminal domain-containing protein n=1 Tax=Aliiglaciecola litoralis TaxID=582857 RepID=A0ABP3WPX8_9ALTE
MRFENFLQALDMGQCKDQIQRQALFDIGLMFVKIDDVVEESELVYMQDWLKSLDWDSDVAKMDYYKTLESKIDHAIAASEVEDFLAHRSSLLSDPWMKENALKLAEDIANADGDVDAREQSALDFLRAKLKDIR